jgi:hypothetical protein
VHVDRERLARVLPQHSTDGAAEHQRLENQVTGPLGLELERERDQGTVSGKQRGLHQDPRRKLERLAVLAPADDHRRPGHVVAEQRLEHLVVVDRHRLSLVDKQ